MKRGSYAIAITILIVTAGACTQQPVGPTASPAGPAQDGLIFGSGHRTESDSIPGTNQQTTTSAEGGGLVFGSGH
jgi:hypothetical protein